MTSIELTEEQREAIALAWIKEQQREHDGYKIVINTLLKNAHMACWSWLDCLIYAIKLCSESYAVKHKHVMGMIEEDKQ